MPAYKKYRKILEVGKYSRANLKKALERNGRNLTDF